MYNPEYYNEPFFNIDRPTPCKQIMHVFPVTLKKYYTPTNNKWWMAFDLAAFFFFEIQKNTTHFITYVCLLYDILIWRKKGQVTARLPGNVRV